MSLRRLGFAGWFGGAATDHGQSQVHQPRHGKRQEQAVIVEALYECGIREGPPVQAGGRRRLDKTWNNNDHADQYRDYGPPIPSARIGVTAVQLVQIGELESSAAKYPVVYDHDGPDGPE